MSHRSPEVKVNTKSTKNKFRAICLQALNREKKFCEICLQTLIRENFFREIRNFQDADSWQLVKISSRENFFPKGILSSKAKWILDIYRK